MASNTYTRVTVDGKTTWYSRQGTQGRKPSGLGKPELYRLYSEDEEKLLILKEKLGRYYNKGNYILDKPKVLMYHLCIGEHKWTISLSNNCET